MDLIEHLKDNYFVVAFDSLGHGLSPRYTDEDLRVPGDAAMEALAQALDYQERLHGKKAVVIGHSMGAAISSKLATLRPELFTGLILEDPAWLSPEQADGYLQRATQQVELGKKWRGDLLGTLQENTSVHPHWEVCSHAAWAYAKTMVDPRLLAAGVVSFPEPWREVAAQITVPTVVITSDTDTVLVGTAGIAAIAELNNPALSVELIPNASHGLRLDVPQPYCEIVDRQLSQWLS